MVDRGADDGDRGARAPFRESGSPFELAYDIDGMATMNPVTGDTIHSDHATMLK